MESSLSEILVVPVGGNASRRVSLALWTGLVDVLEVARDEQGHGLLLELIGLIPIFVIETEPILVDYLH